MPWCSSDRPFNEAAAVRPRKSAEDRSGSAQGIRAFNEAAAVRPRKSAMERLIESLAENLQ